MGQLTQPTVGLALSGSGDRTSFYIGFLEVWQELGLPVDYISACSGASLVAAAFSCGTLPQLKQTVLALDREAVGKLLVTNKEKGGLYSLDGVEQKLLEFTKGLSFEEVRPHMAFISVDIETGKEVVLCMGDIARAARISCTLPAVFKPVKWGGKTLVDGGLLTQIPVEPLRQASMDILIGVNMRGTKHIFTESQIQVKRVYNFLKKVFLIKQLESFIEWFVGADENYDFSENPNFFTVLGKSMDLAISAEAKDESCDLVITPQIPKRLLGQNLTKENIKKFYLMGRQCAGQYAPEIKKLIIKKEKVIA